MKSREVTLHVVRRPDRPARFYALLIRASEVTWERAGAAVPSAGFYALLIRASEVTSRLHMKLHMPWWRFYALLIRASEVTLRQLSRSRSADGVSMPY